MFDGVIFRISSHRLVIPSQSVMKHITRIYFNVNKLCKHSRVSNGIIILERDDSAHNSSANIIVKCAQILNNQDGGVV